LLFTIKEVFKMITEEELNSVLLLANDYKEIKIPKRNGETRIIHIPNPELKKFQKKILRFLKRFFCDDFSFGLNCRSCYQHAEFHCDSRFVFQFDLKNAFHSVSLNLLKKIVSERLDCYPKALPQRKYLADWIIKLTTYKGILPQGTPTSPLLFSIVLNRLWLEIAGLCLPDWKVSCYVDGFVISGKKPLPEKKKEEIFSAVKRFGFQANPEKTREIDCRQGAPLICGLRVDGMKKRVILPKKIIRKWRGLIYLSANNPFDWKLKNKVEGFIGSIEHIYGREPPKQLIKPIKLFRKTFPLPKKRRTANKYSSKGRKYHLRENFSLDHPLPHPDQAHLSFFCAKKTCI